MSGAVFCTLGGGASLGIVDGELVLERQPNTEFTKLGPATKHRLDNIEYAIQRLKIHAVED